MHEHYDADGNLTGTTVVTREAEWDDLERAKMLGLVDYEAKVCECGLHESEADEDPDLELDFRICPTCAGLAKAARAIAQADEKAQTELGQKPDPSEDWPGDGRHVRLRRKIPAKLQSLIDKTDQAHDPRG